MLYFGYLVHAWLMFIAPLIYLGYSPSLKKQSLFTFIYTAGLIIFRALYKVLPIPFGTHTILLIILNVLLLKALIKEIPWMKAIFISLILMIIMLINDALIVLPYMKYFNIGIKDIEANRVLGLWISGIVSNFLLIGSCLFGVLKSRKKQAYNL